MFMTAMLFKSPNPSSTSRFQCECFLLLIFFYRIIFNNKSFLCWTAPVINITVHSRREHMLTILESILPINIWDRNSSMAWLWHIWPLHATNANIDGTIYPYTWRRNNKQKKFINEGNLTWKQPTHNSYVTVNIRELPHSQLNKHR